MGFPLAIRSKVNGATEPVPLTTWVFKLASRCNLNCKYCYMYEGPDQSWRKLPRFMALDHVRAGARLAAHNAVEQGDSEVFIVLHGGEPMLATSGYLAEFLGNCTRATSELGVRATFAIQTNGTIVTPDRCAVLAEYGVEVSVSVDGGRESNDRNRVYVNGHGSHARVIDGIERLRRSGCEPVGAIAVADFQVSAASFMEALYALSIPHLDVLLPDRTHDVGLTHPPDVIADWLIDATTFALDNPAPVAVKSFSTVLKLMYGSEWGLDTWGPKCTGTAVIETDGSILLNDVLRLTREGIGNPRLNVSSAVPGDIKLNGLYSLFTQRASHAASKCQECRFLMQCGGGHISHRFSQDRDFDNESVYCDAIRTYLHSVSAIVARA